MNAIVTAWQFAELATHEPKSNSEYPEIADSIFTPMENVTDYGYIAEFSDRIVIAFEGSKNLKAWITDFMAYPLKWEETLRHTKTGEKGTIHRGFYEAWENYKRPVEEYLLRYSKSDRTTCAITWKNNKLLPIYIYGHSRGGAIAALCARHIAKNMGIPCSCIIFGSPAQGTKEYRNEFNLLPINCADFIHGYEFVLDLPPQWAGFRRVGRYTWLPEGILHKYFYKIRDHFYTTTTKALMRYVRDDPEAITVLETILHRAKI